MSLISVIVPVYRVEPYLRRCVDSILNQTFPDFELILVDDGSPDACPRICDEYALADERVRVIHKENGGLSDARNAGFSVSSGEYIVYIDSDDWIAERFLERLLSVMRDTGCDVCECGAVRVSDEAAMPGQETQGEAVLYETQEALRLLIGDHVLRQHVWNKMYTRSSVEGIAFEVGKTNEDEFWTYQVFGRSACVARIEDGLYAYFQRPGSIMSSGYSLRRLDALEAKSRRQTYIEAHFPALSDDAKANLLFSCVYSGQMVLKHLTREEYKVGRQRINAVLSEHELKKMDKGFFSGKQKVWACMAGVSFWGICRLRNLLKIGM